MLFRSKPRMWLPQTILALTVPVAAPIRALESRLPVRKVHSPTILPHSRRLGAALHAKDIIDKRRCNRRPKYNRQGPHEDEA